MWGAFKGLILLTLLAPLFLVPVHAQESTPEEQAPVETEAPSLEEAPASEEIIIEEVSGKPQKEVLLSEEVLPVEQGGPETPLEIAEEETLLVPAELPSPVFTGIGQTARDATSDHMQSGEWYLGQKDIFFTSPGILRHIVVFPDTEDPDFINCEDTVYGGGTLNIWFGKGSSPADAFTNHFTPTQREHREDGGCVYENRSGVFVYPGPSYTFLLNGGYGPTTAFEYLGSQAPTPELGVAQISNSQVSASQLVWKRDSETVASLSYLMSLGDEPPPVFGVPLNSTYVWAGPGITRSELENRVVLADGTHETPDGFNYTLSNAGLNEPAYFKQSGVIEYARASLGYYHDAPDTPVYFTIEGRDCRTPEKMIYEWGIYSGSKGAFANEVILGPFSGTECGFEAIDPTRHHETVVVVRTMFNGNRSNMTIAGTANLLDITLYSSEVVDPCLENTCVSNVLFLPGIKGSRLYVDEHGSARRLWEPNGNDDVPELFLHDTGKSIREDVYVKPGDVVDDVAFNLMNIYDLFIEDMEALQETGVINDWEAVPYDWRLSLSDIVANGVERDGKIFYNEGTSTPYIEQTLRALAHNSQTGKVTVVAHSNGGLVTKALLQKLGEAETASLVDKIIFVAVPQSGAPQALGALLYGERERLPTQTWLPFVILDQKTARTFAENSPMGYHLLPSQAYFDAVQEDFDHPVARFISGYQEEKNAYGGVIGTFDELSRFLRADDGGRTKPDASNLETANVLNSALIEYTRETHAQLDSWTPPEGVKLYQVAGWGQDTIAGIEFYEECENFRCKEKYRPLFTEDGDGVVPVPSALLTSEDTNANNYWVDLLRSGKDHGNIFGFRPLLDFINKIYRGEHPLSDRVAEESPISNNVKKLRFILHSPLSLELQDAWGNKTNEKENSIEDSSYGEFGEVKFITAPAGGEYTLLMEGYASGTFSLDVQEVIGDEVTSTATIAEVPVTEQTIAHLKESEGNHFLLLVDLNGDTVIDFEIESEKNAVVSYQEPSVTIGKDSSSKGISRVKTIAPAIVPSAQQETAKGEVLGTATSSDNNHLPKDPEVPDDATPEKEKSSVQDSQTLFEILYTFIKWLFSAIISIL